MEILLHIDGMMCQNNCGTTVHNALQSIMGVKSVKVSFLSASAIITLNNNENNPSVTLIDELIEAVEDVGFDACLMKDSEPTHLLTIGGMMCQRNCGTTVQNALLGVNGVCLAEVSFELEQARVWGAQSTLPELIEAVEDVGFEAELFSSADKHDDGDDDDAAPDAVFDFLCSIDEINDPINITNILLQVDGVMTVDVDTSHSPQQVKIWGFLDTDNVYESLTAANYSVKLALSSSIHADINRIHQKPTPTLEKQHLQMNQSADESSEFKGVTDNDDCFIVPLLVGGMSCANCSKGIENRLMKISGILNVRIALLSGKVDVYYDVKSITDSNIIIQAIIDMGYTAELNGNPYSVKSNNGKKNKVLSLSVSGMSCASCATKIENMLTILPGVVSATVSCLTEKAHVEMDESLLDAVGPRDVMARIDEMGYKSRHVIDDDDNGDGDGNSDIQAWWRLLMIAALLGGPVVILHFSMIFSPALMTLLDIPVLCGGGVLAGQVVMVCLNAPLQFIVGYRFYRGAYLSALHGSFGMDALVVTGTTIAFTYSSIQLAASCISGVPTMHVFFETSGMLLLFVTMGKYFEAYAKGTTISAMTSLLKLQPRQAVLVTAGSDRYIQKKSNDDGDKINENDSNDYEEEKTDSIDIDLIQKGDIIKVLPGARLPTDGIIVAGSSYIDESLITGESMPVERVSGSTVYGSTVNQKGLLYVQVTSVGSDSALAQIVQLVEAAQMDKAPIQAYADVVAGIFTPTVLCLSLCTFTVWFFLSSSDRIPASWYLEAGYGEDPLLFSLLFCISVVVISCPCALGLATPTAIMVGTSVGASNGILIKGGPPFEVAHRINSIIFDKTGTLTKGKPTVTDEIDLLTENTTSTAFRSRDKPPSTNGQNTIDTSLHPQNQVIRLAAIAEVGSEHPLGESIIQAAKDREIVLPDTSHATFSLHSGGISCTFEDQTSIRVGNRTLMEENSITLSALVDAAMYDLEVQGKTAVCVAYNSVIVGILGIADVIKPEAVKTVRALQNMNIDVYMCTGDNQTTAEAIGDELGLGVDRIIAGALPGDKVKLVERLQVEGKHVAMVGDGINDSPALARADLGIAVGAGTHIAIDAADMVIVRNNLLDVIVALDLAKVVFRRIKINLRWALLYNILAIPIAAGALFPWFHTILPPQYAGLCMALSSISVVASSLMLKFYKRPKICKDGDVTLSLQKTDLLSKLSSKDKTTKKTISSVISRARGRLSNLKAELTRQFSGDELGEYSRVPSSGSLECDDDDDDTEALSTATTATSSSSLSGGDIEMGRVPSGDTTQNDSMGSAMANVGGLDIVGLPGGGMPPSMEWA